MSGYILCQIKRAKVPYYIENISTNIYSIEELCFYLYHNIYLLDTTIINEELCFWIRDELGLKKLAQKLYNLLGEELKVGDFILPVFKEINYLSLEEFRKLNQQIQKIAQEPDVLRQKLKGDYLMEHGKYVNAIKVYQKALHDKALGNAQKAREKAQEPPMEKAAEKSQEKTEGADLLGGQFIGGIYHNMGCAYARLFQMEEAIHCFSMAYEHLRTMGSIKSYLYAVYMESGVKAFEEKAAVLGVEGQRREEILNEVEKAAEEIFETADGREYAKALEKKESGNLEEYRAAVDEMLKRLTREYHRSTGY